MRKIITSTTLATRLALIGTAVAGVALGAAIRGAAIAALVGALVLGVVWMLLHRVGQFSLTGSELDRLRQAELSLASAADPREAAEELAEHAMALLDARAAVVLIEGIGDTVRVSSGPTRSEDVYGSGSRMRLLADAGVPCGSIAVSARADGKPYTERDERILDALAERVSTTLHQLSLLAQVMSERHKLADLIGASSDGIFSVGPDLRVVAWNAAMASITGVAADEAIGGNISSSFDPVDETGQSLTGANDPGRRGEPVSSILVRLAGHDEDRWVTCSYAPLPDGGYVVVARDETERKKVQDDKDGWIAQVSHELRTPLTPLKGFLHTLSRRDDILTGEDRQRIYEVMLREELRLEDLVNSLLRSTQLDRADLVVVPEAIDWTDIVAAEVERAARFSPGRPINVDLDSEVGLVLGDATFATSILSNLLSNACKYSAPDTPISIEVTTDGDMVMTSVVDHGPGVPRTDRTRIFDKFTRLGDHLTRPQQGVGLGLHIARQAVTKMGGEIWVDTTKGGGATFRFTLPASDAASAAPRWLGDTGRPSRRRRQLAAKRPDEA